MLALLDDHHPLSPKPRSLHSSHQRNLCSVRISHLVSLWYDVLPGQSRRSSSTASRHPLLSSTSLSAKLSPKRIIHDLGWMGVMVSADDARHVFGRAFSRPPRLLLGNPVAFIVLAYYAYIYGRHRLHKASFVELMESLAIIYVFLVSVPLLFGSPPFSRSGLFSYEWPQSTLSLAYVGMGELRPYRA